MVNYQKTVNMNTNTANLSELFSKWKAQGVGQESILQELNAKGYDDNQKQEILGQYSKHGEDARISLGWNLMAIGSIFGFLSCLLTMLDLIPSCRGLCLYGLTTVGVSMAFYGCYLVMEK
jgi:hypothetical protein